MITYIVHLFNEEHGLDSLVNIPEDKYILEAAEEFGLELPYSCRSGSCSTCLGLVIEGHVEQPDQVFLDEEQMASGYALTCVSYPSSNLKVLTHQEKALY